MIIIATIVLVGAACCYGLSRRLSWGGVRPRSWTKLPGAPSRMPRRRIRTVRNMAAATAASEYAAGYDVRLQGKRSYPPDLHRVAQARSDPEWTLSCPVAAGEW